MSTPFFFRSCSGDHRDLHSFPTRRSSDLTCYDSFSGIANGGCVVEGTSTGGAAGAATGPAAGGSSVTTTYTVSANTNSAFARSEEHTSELQSQSNLVCRLLLEKKKNKQTM